jgi:ribosomal protein S10
MQEVWRSVKGFEGVYEVSNLGNVRRLDTLVPFSGTLALRRGRQLKLTRNSKGYLTIILCFGGKRKTFSVHRLVADAFILNVPGLTQINHIDGNTFNNREDNLERCTPGYNQLHAYQTGLKGRGSKSGMAKLNEAQVREIKKELEACTEKFKNRTYKRISERYSVTKSTIKWIDKGRTWRHVKLHDD